MEYRNWVFACFVLSTLNGCGDPDSGSAGGAGSGGMSSAGASGAAVAGDATGGTSTSGSGGNAMAGTSAAGSATAGTSTGAGGSCSGVFGMAFPAMLEDATFQMNGISLTADELELYYSRGQNGVPTPTLVRRKRGSTMEMFGMVEPLLELAGVCAENQRLNPDVSDDGLTLYVTCTNVVDIGLSEGVSQLRVAHRPDRNAAFTLAAEPIGGVYASAGISADELTAYSDGEIFDTAPQMFTRTVKTEMFGEAQPVPGIDAPLNSPDISSDGLALFGSATPAGASGNAIHRAVRASQDADFGPPQALDLQLPAMSAVGAPNITPDCSLYLIVVLPSIGHTMHQAIVP